MIMAWIGMDDLDKRKFLDSDTGLSDKSDYQRVCGHCVDIRQHICESCSMANVFCQTCALKVCVTCANKGRNEALPRCHKDEQFENTQTVCHCLTGNLLSDTEHPFNFCRRHNERFRFYCETDVTLCCSTCLFESHSTCEGLKRLSEFSCEDKRASSEKINELKRRYSKVKLEKEMEITEIEETAKCALVRIQVLKKKILSHLEEMEKATIQQINEVKKRQCELVQCKLDVCKQSITNLDLLHKYRQSGLSDVNYVEDDVFRMETELGQTEVTTLQSDICALENDPIGFNLDFRFSGFVEHVLSAKSFGELEVKPFLKKLRRCISDGAMSQESSTLRENQYCLSTSPSRRCKSQDRRDSTEKYSPRKPRCTCAYTGADLAETHNLNMLFEKQQCCIIGMVRLQDGCFVVADAKNRRLKCYANNFKLKSALSLPSAPWGIAYIVGQGEVAVTLPNQKTIQIVGISHGRLSMRRQIRTHGDCHGIAYSVKHDLLIVSSTSPAMVEVMDTNGQIQRIISEDLCSGERLFQTPYFLAFDENQSMIYVSDMRKSRLSGLTLKGDVVFVSEQISGPGGITFDPAGHLYVVELNTNRIKTCTPSGGNIRNLGSKVKHYPWCIVYSLDRHSVFVGTNNGFVNRYNLKKYTRNSKVV